MASALLAAFPIGLVFVLLLAARWSAIRAGAAGLLVAVLLAWWQFDLASGPGGTAGALAGAAAEATFTSATILWIILPALAIHRLQGETGAVEVLRRRLGGLAADRRVSALLVAWFFALLLEGAAGFGTPAALAAPFLVALGVPPVTAVTAALLGHAVGVSFGAVGTPIVPMAAATGLEPSALSAATAPYGATVGWIFLLAVAVLVSRGVPGGSEVTKQSGYALAAWTFVAGAAFLVPYWAIATWVGPELPTLGGAVLGGSAFVGALALSRRRRAPPANEDTGPGHEAASTARAAAPYLVLVALVLATRLVEPFREALRPVQWRWELGGGAYQGGIELLYHPGTMLALAFLAGAAWQGASARDVGRAVAETLHRLVPVAAALLVMLGLARILVHGGLIDVLATQAAGTLGGAWPLFAPVVGALGSFVTGSATASNALFSDLQLATAREAGLAVPALLGAQGIGAAIGNVIAPHNLIAAAAVVGLTGREAELLRRTLPVAAIALVVAGAVALLLTAASGR